MCAVFVVVGIGRDAGRRLSMNQWPPRVQRKRRARGTGSSSSSVYEDDGDISLGGGMYLKRH